MINRTKIFLKKTLIHHLLLLLFFSSNFNSKFLKFTIFVVHIQYKFRLFYEFVRQCIIEILTLLYMKLKV